MACFFLVILCLGRGYIVVERLFAILAGLFVLSTPPEPASKTAKITAEELANVLQVFIQVSCGIWLYFASGVDTSL
jgi:hypothetical protein